MYQLAGFIDEITSLSLTLRKKPVDNCMSKKLTLYQDIHNLNQIMIKWKYDNPRRQGITDLTMNLYASYHRALWLI